jgi:hypothetical protein
MTEPELPSTEERVRFETFGLKRFPNGDCEARVTLTWAGHPSVTGEARGHGSESGELRCAAQACLNALGGVIRHTAFELLGVKAVRAFDSSVVIVSIAATGQGGGPRLVGSCLADADLPKGAALAVLNATNRIISRPPGLPT